MAPLLALYDPLFGGLPADQGWLAFAAVDPLGGVVQTASAGGTRLSTMANPAAPLLARAGWSSHRPDLPQPVQALFPALDTSLGFSLRLELTLHSESHSANPNRAGFALTLIGADLRGIELGVQAEAVFAQEGGEPASLFRRAEHAALSSGPGRHRFELLVVGDRYLLSAESLTLPAGNGGLLLSGPLRDYGAFNPAAAGLPYSPYATPGLLAFGDATTSAGADLELGAVELSLPRLGGAGDDLLQAEPGGEILQGLGGGDTLRGGLAADALIGGPGPDLLRGGPGADILIGGEGADRFVLTGPGPAASPDTIVDFEAGLDRIVLDRARFSRLPAAHALPGFFALVVSEAEAAASPALLVYNSCNGHLLFNANGSRPGFGGGGLIARLLGEDPDPASALLAAGALHLAG